MFFNILMGLIIPSFFGGWLYKKDKSILIKVGPLTSLLALLICFVGGRLKLWVLKPKLRRFQILTTLPYCIGLYPVLASYFIYFTKKLPYKPSEMVLMFTCLTTLGEFVCRLFKHVEYGKGWDMTKTFVSYLIPYYLILKFYDLRKNKKVH